MGQLLIIVPIVIIIAGVTIVFQIPLWSAVVAFFAIVVMLLFGMAF